MSKAAESELDTALIRLQKKRDRERKARLEAEAIAERVTRELNDTVLELKRANTANETLELFAHVAAHDLQEPLRMVASYCRLLQERYEGRLDQDADEFINFAVDGATRMQALIADLLAYSLLGARTRPPKPTDCESVFARAIENLRPWIDESGAVVTHDSLPTVTADPSELVEVFQNLISNALKFRGGQVPEIHVAAEHRDNEWLFSVTDNGIGIDPQYGEKIFGVFQRLHGRGDYPGTGIGLSICKRIIESHAGRIWVGSEPGKGATFYFTLPVD